MYSGHLYKELLFGDKSEPGADVAVAKVATLSEHAFEAPRNGSDLNPVLTAGVTTRMFAPVASSSEISPAPVSTSSRLDGAPHPLNGPKEKQAGITALPMTILSKARITKADTLLKKASLRAEESRGTSRLDPGDYNIAKERLE